MRPHAPDPINYAVPESQESVDERLVKLRTILDLFQACAYVHLICVRWGVKPMALGVARRGTGPDRMDSVYAIIGFGGLAVGA